MEYTQLYGSSYFQCQPLRALLSVRACSDNHLRKRCLSCFDCSLGKLHAQQEPSPGHATTIDNSGNSRPLHSCMGKACIRCNEQHFRLMALSFCPSCWNRMLEIVRGRNSKGSWPAKAAAKLRHVRAIIDLPNRTAIDRFMASETAACKALRFTRYGPNSIWFEGVLGGTEELSRMLARTLPGATLLDADSRPVTAGCISNPSA